MSLGVPNDIFLLYSIYFFDITNKKVIFVVFNLRITFIYKKIYARFNEIKH